MRGTPALVRPPPLCTDCKCLERLDWEWPSANKINKCKCKCAAGWCLQVPAGRSFSLQQLTAAVEQHRPALLFLTQACCGRASVAGAAWGGTACRRWGCEWRRWRLWQALRPVSPWQYASCLPAATLCIRAPLHPTPPPTHAHTHNCDETRHTNHHNPVCRVSRPPACARAWTAWASCARRTALCSSWTAWPPWAACPFWQTPGAWTPPTPAARSA